MVSDAEKMNRVVRVARAVVDGYGYGGLWASVASTIQRDPRRTLSLYDDIKRILDE